MSRGSRAARAHARPLVQVAASVAVLAGGLAAAVSALAAGPDARTATALPLLLLGVLVVSLPALEVARRRRDELSLVRVRTT